MHVYTPPQLHHLHIRLRRKLQPQILNRIMTMPQHHLRPRPPRQPLDHLMTPAPRLVVPSQPPLRDIVLPILLHMVLIARENPTPGLGKVDLHDAQAGRVPRRVMQVYALRDLEVRAVEGHPVEIEGEVVREVDAEVGFGGDGVEGVFEFELVGVAV